MQNLGYVGGFSPGAFQQPLQILGLREEEVVGEGEGRRGRIRFWSSGLGCGCGERGGGGGRGCIIVGVWLVWLGGGGFGCTFYR